MTKIATFVVIAASITISPVVSADTVVSTGQDVVYVSGKDAGVFAGKVGTVQSLTPTELILESNTGLLLLTRDAVRYVELSSDTATVNPEWQELLGRRWNVETSANLRAVKSLPVIGPPLGTVLSEISPLMASTIALIPLVIALLWAMLKTYEIGIVSRETRKLERTKAQLEIAKLRHEAIALCKDRDDPLLAAIQALELPFSRQVGVSGEPHSSHGARHSTLDRIGAAFLTMHDRATFRTIYAAEAKLWLERGRTHLETARFKRTIALSTAILASLLYVFGVLPDAIVDVYEAYDQESLVAAIVRIVVSIVLLRQAVRLALKLRDTRAEYAGVLGRVAVEPVTA